MLQQTKPASTLLTIALHAERVKFQNAVNHLLTIAAKEANIDLEKYTFDLVNTRWILKNEKQIPPKDNATQVAKVSHKKRNKELHTKKR